MSKDTKRPVLGFTLTGKEVAQWKKATRPAWPKKNQESGSSVLLTVGNQVAKLTLAGAAVDVAARTMGGFTVRMPWVHWKAAWSGLVVNGTEIAFAFTPGEFTCNGVTARSKDIVVIESAGADPITAAEQAVDAHATVGELGAFLGLPLIAGYRQTREHGIQPTLMNRPLLRQQVQVERILEKAEKLLKPLGISRADLQGLLDRKIGDAGR